MRYKPTLLLILDGWGIAPDGPGNAVSIAGTENINALFQTYPHTRLLCSGRAVGLPEGFMGNSEVGHMNIGAGRVIYQDMTRIDLAIENDTLKDNPALLELIAKTKAAGGRLHFMGLVSDGGVHSHVAHLHALLAIAKTYGLECVVHAFLDGRDTPPTSGCDYVRDLRDFMAAGDYGRIATVVGRYYAMDRDKRWDRNTLAYDALTMGRGAYAQDPVEAIQEAYAAGEHDEFVKPRVIVDGNGKPLGPLRQGDGLFFFNFRADRARQISRALFEEHFSEFTREAWPQLACFATMTQYEQSFPMPAAFGPESVSHTLGQVVSALGMEQLRIAETEKYAHVTYFFNCGLEEPLSGEERMLIPSPREVATYDLKPQMSAEQVTDTCIEQWNSGRFSLVVCNLANLDMVGHTGVIPAVVEACNTVDNCVKKLVDTVLAGGGRVLLTADHGNAEEMLDDKGRPQTAHSKNPVPFVLIDAVYAGCGDAVLRAQGILGDIAPTVLHLWGVDKPESMTGQSLLSEKPHA